MGDTAAAEEQDLRILVVDDDAMTRHVVLAVLARIGHRADTASSGADALLAVESKRYDVILMDLLMPEMSGIEATRRILGAAQEGTRPRIIAMTASELEDDHAACRAAGMTEVLLKPVRLDALRSALGP